MITMARADSKISPCGKVQNSFLVLCRHSGSPRIVVQNAVCVVCEVLQPLLNDKLISLTSKDNNLTKPKVGVFPSTLAVMVFENHFEGSFHSHVDGLSHKYRDRLEDGTVEGKTRLNWV
jgi:hypothetical protein